MLIFLFFISVIVAGDATLGLRDGLHSAAAQW